MHVTISRWDPPARSGVSLGPLGQPAPRQRDSILHPRASSSPGVGNNLFQWVDLVFNRTMDVCSRVIGPRPPSPAPELHSGLSSRTFL